MSVPTISATAEARDVEVVCCTKCCVSFRKQPPRMQGHMITDHTRRRAIYPEGSSPGVTVTIDGVRRASGVILVSRTD